MDCAVCKIQIRSSRVLSPFLRDFVVVKHNDITDSIEAKKQQE